MYLKNTASQKVGLVMVDKTDFATPETGISPSGVIRKDGGASAALSNAVSELTNGYYVVTLSQGETNADLLQLRFHDAAASCATQFIVIKTEGNKINSILADTAEIVNVRADTTSILNDTRTLSNATYGLDALETITSTILAGVANATYGLDALETITSDILEALDSVTAGPIASILVDTNATLDNKIDSILEDTKEINSQCDSILADTITLSNATYGLDALESLTSQILADTGTTLENRQSSILNKTTSILTDTGTTLDNRQQSILVDTGTTLDNRQQSILADTITLSNATYGLDALETLCSQILADTGTTLENRTVSIVDQASQILADTGTTLNNKIDSILADTITLSNATYGLDALETLCSQILADTGTTLENRQTSILNKATSILIDTTSILVDTGTTLDNKIDSILEDTKTTLDDKIDSILVDTASILVDTGTTVDNKVDSILIYVNSAIAEMAAGAPPASPTPRQAQNYLYRCFRNKIETTSAATLLYADDEATVLCSTAVSDDGTTFIKGEHV